MLNEELDIVQTCGLCEMIISQKNIETHSCLEGYTKYYTDSSTLYFYPMTDDQTIIKKSLIQNEGSNTTNVFNKENLSGNQHLKRSLSLNILEKRKKPCLSFDEEELLILEVQKREPLWNFQLDLKHRNAKIIKILWQEVSDALNSIISPEAAKNKFKSLHDTYRKIIQSEQKPSGSERARTTRLWHHYQNMEFLRDSCLIKNTVSNISSNTGTSENLEVVNVLPAKRLDNQREKSNNQTAIERIANAFCDLTNNNDDIVLPPPPQPDDIDSFLNLLGSRIRRLSEAQKQEAFQKHLQLSYDMLIQYM